MADLPPDWLQTTMGAKTANVIAGLMGGIVRGLVNPTYTWPMRLTTAVVGAITAGYGTPLVSPAVRRWFDLWHYPIAGDVEGSVGFFLGLCGMTLCEVAIRYAKLWRDGTWQPPAPPAAPPKC